DIAFPALYDAATVGESALERALPWDRITPVRHRIYYDLQAALPELMRTHQQRAKSDPDFIFLQKELEMAEAARKQTRLSLNEENRKRELADEQAKRLAMENARRKAKGLEPLAALESSPSDGELDPAGEAPLPGDEGEAKKDEPDPLLF